MAQPPYKKTGPYAYDGVVWNIAVQHTDDGSFRDGNVGSSLIVRSMVLIFIC